MFLEPFSHGLILGFKMVLHTTTAFNALSSKFHENKVSYLVCWRKANMVF